MPRKSKLDPALALYLKLRSIAKVVEHFKGKGLRGYSRATLERRCAAEKWAEIAARVDAQAAEKLAEKIARAPARAPSNEPSEGGGVEGGAEGAGDGTRGQEAVIRQATAYTLVRKNRYLEAMDAAIERVAEENAEEAHEDLRRLSEAHRLVIQSAYIAVTQANAFIVAHSVRLTDTGQRDADGTPILEAETDGMADTGRFDPIAIAIENRAQALDMLAAAQAVLDKAAARGPLAVLQKDGLALRQLAKQVEFLTMRVEGTLPPDKVQHEFLQQQQEQLDRLEKLMPADAFAQYLDAIERDARTRATGAGGEVPSPGGRTAN